MVKRFSRRAEVSAFALACSIALSGCGSTSVRVGPVSSAPVPEYGQADYSGAESADYVLRPSDVIAVSVFREPDLTLESVPVGADGMVSLPLIGAIKASGLTARDLEQQVAERLVKAALISPKVSINVTQFGSHLVTVEGSVDKPGMYPFRPGTRLSGAMSLAAGPTRVAKLSEVAIFRQTAAGMSIAKFDYGAVRAGTMLDPVLQPNDRVVVGTSGLSQFWQDLLKTIPALALFTNI